MSFLVLWFLYAQPQETTFTLINCFYLLAYRSHVKLYKWCGWTSCSIMIYDMLMIVLRITLSILIYFILTYYRRYQNVVHFHLNMSFLAKIMIFINNNFHNLECRKPTLSKKGFYFKNLFIINRFSLRIMLKQDRKKK